MRKIMRKLLFKIFKAVLRLLFRVKVIGLENFRATHNNHRNKRLVISNHQSYLDAALIACFVSEDLSFAIGTFVAEIWWIKPFTKLFKVFKLNTLDPFSVKSLINYIKEGNDAVIFPEGRLTMTGSLMKVYNGPALIADKSGAIVIPVTLDGPERSFFSVLKDVMRLRLFPQITIKIHAPVSLKLDAGIVGQQRREILGTKLYEIMNEANFQSANLESSLYETLLESSYIHGINKTIAIDPMRNSLSYKDLIASSRVLAGKLQATVADDEKVALMLPTSLPCLSTFFALQRMEKTPVMLNFSMGISALLKSAEISKIKHIISSRDFLEKAKLTEVQEALEQAGVKFVFLEDIKTQINVWDKLAILLSSKSIKPVNPDDDALILFTSGSEGTPKGVVLSHRNLLANYYQLKASYDLNPQDVVLNALPLFHSFGMTAGMLMPIFAGIKALYYPSPLHYRIIPELAYQYDVTLLYGTDTFLRGYAKYAHSYDFYKLRYVIAGAEKLKEDTRRVWADKLGARVFEAYGATETAPGISVNTPLCNKVGTVGKIMPGIESKLEEIPGISNGQKLIVKGPNVMKGYLLDGHEGIIPPTDGWYDTGDIVSFDDEGYMSIQGRVKRFAKIAGEMVSLGALESALVAFDEKSSSDSAVINVPDDKKGEKLILFTTNKELDKDQLKSLIKDSGLSELAMPREIRLIDKLPLLGSGKLDYKTMEQMYCA